MRLFIVTSLLLSAYSLQGQYLLDGFKPKIKGASHTAQHIVQDDGKIVMLGDYAFAGDTPIPNLLRLKSDGSLDKEFILSNELQNQFTTDFRQCCLQANVVKGPGGDLVLLQGEYRRRVTIIDQFGKFKTDIAVPAGYFQFEHLIKHKDGYIAIALQYGSGESVFRLDQNGKVDPTFTRIDFMGYVEKMIVYPNNSILIAGDLNIAGVSRNLVKINELGVLDNTFSNVQVPVSFAEIDLFPDGKIVLSSGNQIILLDANGNKVGSFVPDTGGKQIYSSVIDQVNNRIVIVIDQYPLPTAVKSLNLDGSLSNLFTPINLGIGPVNALAGISRIGQKFLLTATNEINYGNSVHSFLVFDAAGIVDINISAKEKIFSVGQVNTAIELNGNDLIIGGAFSHIGNTQVNNLAKIDKSGKVDIAFANNNPLAISDIVSEVKISTDNKLYIGGFFHNILGQAQSSLIRLNTDGELDASFVTTLTSNASGAFLDDFIIMHDRIIACGYYSGKVVAFDFNGKTIPTFNTNIFGSQFVSVNSLCKIDEDNFAIGGYVLNAKGFLWIMDKDGNIDNSFTRQDQIPISSDHLVKVGNELYRSGYILGGQSSSDANFIYKYNLQTGVIGPSNLATYTISENKHMLPLNDSMVVVSGEFDRFKNKVANNFAVSDYEGSVYERLAFDVSTGVKGHYVEKTILLSNERILLLGTFNEINDKPFYSVAILNYANFKPQVTLKEKYSIPEDTSFYLMDIVEIIDKDDEVTISVDPNDKLTVGQNGLIKLKQDFSGSIKLDFRVKDALTAAVPFTTTLEVRPINDAPVIKGQKEIPIILPGEKYKVQLGLLDVVDVDGDNLTLILQTGKNYSLVDETSILSDASFNGHLDVSVSVSDGLLTSEAFLLSIISDRTTGIEEVSNLAFYPNPFEDQIRIDSWESIEHLSIRSPVGQEVIHYNHDDLNKNSGVIQAGMLSNGIFLLSVTLKTSEVRHIKLLKR